MVMAKTLIQKACNLNFESSYYKAKRKQQQVSLNYVTFKQPGITPDHAKFCLKLASGNSQLMRFKE